MASTAFSNSGPNLGMRFNIPWASIFQDFSGVIQYHGRSLPFQTMFIKGQIGLDRVPAVKTGQAKIRLRQTGGRNHPFDTEISQPIQI